MSNHVILAVIAVIVLWVAYSQGWFGISKAATHVTAVAAAVPAAMGSVSTLPMSPTICGHNQKSLVNGAAVVCPDTATYSQAKCSAGTGPCACWL